MSCITEILKVKGDRPYLVTENHAIESGGTYKNYEWLITLTNNGHRCGYVAVNKNHPLHGKDLTSWNCGANLQVHGGVTFSEPGNHVIDAVLGKSNCEDMWIGFDAIHAGDQRDYNLAEKLWNKKIPEWHKFFSSDCKIRSNKYMEKECKKLINQLIKIEENKND